MPPATHLLLLAVPALFPVLGYAIIPRDILRYGPLEGPASTELDKPGSEQRDNSISSDNGGEEAVVFAEERERRIEGFLEKKLESVLDEVVVAELRALEEPRLEQLLRAPARLLAARPADLEAALDRPAYEALRASAAQTLAGLPLWVLRALRPLLRRPLRQLLRPDPEMEGVLDRSFINTPDRPATCAPGQSTASDGTCRDMWRRNTR